MIELTRSIIFLPNDNNENIENIEKEQTQEITRKIDSIELQSKIASNTNDVNEFANNMETVDYHDMNFNIDRSKPFESAIEEPEEYKCVYVNDPCDVNVPSLKKQIFEQSDSSIDNKHDLKEIKLKMIKKRKRVEKGNACEEDQEGLESRKKYKRWSEKENIVLVHCVQKLGKSDWSEIHELYSRYFDDDRNSKDLKLKYLHLEKNINELEYLENKSLKDIDMCDEKLDVYIEKWSEKETIDLVYGVQTLGIDNWIEIHKKYFDKNRTVSSLGPKYSNLIKSNKLEYYKKKAELLK